MRVLVTAAGAAPAVAVIRALRSDTARDNFVVAVDAKPDAAGLYLANAGAVVPLPTSPDYVDELLRLAKHHDIGMVVPIFDSETPVCAESEHRFAAAGVHLAANRLTCVLDANDKRRSFDVCAAAGIRQPERYERPDGADVYPVIGRTITGQGSRGVVVVRDRDTDVPSDVDVDAYVWQRLISGQEYSIDTFGDPSGDSFVAVPRRRLLVRSGQSVKGDTCSDPDLIRWARDVCRAFGAHDVCCLQVIRAEDGSLYFVEINPRYGSGVSLSIQAGVDFPRLQWLSAYDPERITPDMLQFRPGVEMIRFWDEIYR